MLYVVMIHACAFPYRNGTPRQPLLVPLARSRLQLAADIPSASFEGLEQFSHCWVLYIFHENTGMNQDGTEWSVRMRAADCSGCNGPFVNVAYFFQHYCFHCWVARLVAVLRPQPSSHLVAVLLQHLTCGSKHFISAGAKLYSCVAV